MNDIDVYRSCASELKFIISFGTKMQFAFYESVIGYLDTIKYTFLLSRKVVIFYFPFILFIFSFC